MFAIVNAACATPSSAVHARMLQYHTTVMGGAIVTSVQVGLCGRGLLRVWSKKTQQTTNAAKVIMHECTRHEQHRRLCCVHVQHSRRPELRTISFSRLVFVTIMLLHQCAAVQQQHYIEVHPCSGICAASTVVVCNIIRVITSMSFG